VLAAAHRLRRSSEFAAALRGGRRAGRGSVVVHLAGPPDVTGIDSPPKPAGNGAPRGAVVRAGFIVSRGVGGAVVRNRVKRRLRHLVAERLDGLPPGSTLVVRALPAAATTPYPRLAADLDAAIDAARAPRARRRSG
jgi:ribonuclease P protein component